MNSKTHDFSVPDRQAKLAIVLLILKYYKIVIRQAWPFLIVAFLGKGDKKVQYFIYLLIFISIAALVMAILAYYRFYFYVKDDELFIEKGVFKKTKLNIPFERIQTVNFEQNIILQAFNHVKIEVDTAGSAKKEFSFEAMEKGKAVALRDFILAGKHSLQLEKIDDSEESESIPLQSDFQEPEKTIFKLDFLDLFKIGITENHLKAGLWILGGLLYLFSNLEDAGIDINREIDNYGLRDFAPNMAIIIFLFVFSIILLVVISLVRTFLRNFDLSMHRTKKGFKIYSGLLNRKEFSAPDHKIQRISWADNPLKRIFGIYNIWLHQARSSDAGKKKSIGIPIVSMEKINAILQYLYTEEELANFENYQISKLYFYRILLLFVTPLTLLLSGVAYFLFPIYFIALPILIGVYLGITNYVRFKKSQYSFNLYMLNRKKGIYSNYNQVMPWYKIQAVDLVQSIYQRRKNLATLHIYSAAGGITIPYIPLDAAQKLRDYALFKAESSHREWM